MKKRDGNNSFLSNKDSSDLIEQIRKSKMYLKRTKKLVIVLLRVLKSTSAGIPRLIARISVVRVAELKRCLTVNLKQYLPVHLVNNVNFHLTKFTITYIIV